MMQSRIYFTRNGNRVEYALVNGQYLVTEHADGYAKTNKYPPSLKADAWQQVQNFLAANGGMLSR